MNKIINGIASEYEIPMFTFNTKTKEFSVLEHKFEGVNSIEDFINYIHNLDKENKHLKSVLNEVKEIIETKFLETELYGSELVCISVENYKKVKTTLDKVGGFNE